MPTIKGIHVSTLYKYYSSSFSLNDYLLNPTIRLSQANSLNDPFEGRLNDEIINLITKNLISTGTLISKGTEDADYNEMIRILKKKIRTIGIASLTETQRNLLMWSHYASEHMGVCIGYDQNMIENGNSDYFSDCFSTTPVKVSYDSVVFDDENKARIENAKEIDTAMLNQILRRAFSTKGDAWIYEKEHRIILPLEYCHQIIIDPTANRPQDAQTALDIMMNSKWYRIEKLKDSEKISIFPSCSGSRPMIDRFTSCENYLSLDKNSLFLRKIEKCDIRYIYLGYKYPKEKEDKLIELISDPSNNLNHIHVFKMDLSNDRFDLVNNLVHKGES